MKITEKLLVFLLIISAVCISSCKKTTDQTDFIMNTYQQEVYNGFIDGIVSNAATGEISSENLKDAFNVFKENLKDAKLKIIDKENGKAVKQGTSADELKKRFIPHPL